MRLPIIASVALLAACSGKGDERKRSVPESEDLAEKESRVTDAANPSTEQPVPWSDAKSGLQLRLLGPEQPATGKELPLRLQFRRTGEAPIRIYFLLGEAHRGFQSSLVIKDESGAVLEVQPPPRPHGYVVTEKDFHLLSDGLSEFTQTLYLSDKLAGKRDLKVTWNYSNKITEWTGGVQTLDGKTKSLFDGKPIPHIWTGALSASLAVKLP